MTSFMGYRIWLKIPPLIPQSEIRIHICSITPNSVTPESRDRARQHSPDKYRG